MHENRGVQGVFYFIFINEFKTSILCPACENSELEKFKKMQNPKALQKRKKLTVTCHGFSR
ncbi:hypothetical protein BDF14DRAFT_1717395 [Spinellus fusiger]|nr:hypothetical protein BDF14DRAFT_1717395 [Spinellus fusiger]